MNGDVVHIVMATYNGERFLREQLDSLLCQSYENITIEICDDGSRDGTLEIVREYCTKDRRVTLHRNETNKGYVKNFLEGIKRSTAPYIMLCDQDDIWHRDKVERTLAKMKQTERAEKDIPVLVYTDAMNYDSGTGRETGRFHETSHLHTKKVDTAHLFMENKCIGCTVMVNRSMQAYLEELPDEIRVHDWWLALIASHFGVIGYLSEPTLLYRQHSDNMIGGDTYHDYVRDRLSKTEKQRAVLRQTYRQGAAFLKCFRSRMSEEQIRTAEQFAELETSGWVGRRRRVIANGFYKSGLVRNVGLMLLM